MKISIAGDHVGYDYKEALKSAVRSLSFGKLISDLCLFRFSKALAPSQPPPLKTATVNNLNTLG
ncbi:MAG: hypothetical protein ACI9CE_001134 [Flavobacterium sp.]|jgi:hypothetical protein